MHIACSINKDFIQHMCVMLKSLEMNTEQRKVTVHILHGDLDENDQQFIIKQFIDSEILIFNFYKVNKDIVKSIPIVPESLTIETLYRLLLPIELPTEIDKILYIDSDIVIKDDVSKVFNTELGDYHLAAVVDVFESILNTIQFDSILDYFNAGFILINLKKWREENFLLQCLDFANKNPEKIILADQDVLNGVLQGNWIRLPLKWNVMRNLIFNKQPYLKYFSEGEIEHVIDNPSLIHYTSKQKPWHLLDDHPYKEEYFSYLNELSIPYDRYSELKILEDKELVLFGTGVKSDEFTKTLTSLKLDVSFYVDNNSSKWGTHFNNKEVFSPSTLTEESEKYFVIIASQYYSDISQQLLEYGYVKEWEGFVSKR